MANTQEELDECYRQGQEVGNKLRPFSGPWGHAGESREDWEERNEEYEKGKRDSLK